VNSLRDGLVAENLVDNSKAANENINATHTGKRQEDEKSVATTTDIPWYKDFLLGLQNKLNLFIDYLYKRKRKYKNITSNVYTYDSWFPASHEIMKVQNSLRRNHNLYIVDMHEIYYSKHSIVSLLKKLYKPRTIYLVSDKVLNQRETSFLFPYVILYKLQIIIEHEDIAKRVKKIYKTIDNFHKYFSIIKDPEISELKRYKLPTSKGEIQPDHKPKSNKVSTFIYPSTEEITQVREEVAKQKNLILWDLENISHREMDTILKKIPDQGLIVCVSACYLSQTETDSLFPYILKYGIQLRVGHEDSDEIIKELIRSHYRNFAKTTIISCDSDFAVLLNEVLQNGKKVHIILKDIQKRRMLMYIKLDHKNLIISTI